MTQQRSPLPVTTLILVIGLNVALIGFFALWLIADNQAVNASEVTGFTESSMLPNSNLMWVAAYASLLLLLALDVCLVGLWRRRPRGRSEMMRQEVPLASATR